MPKLVDHSGKRYGFWTVIARAKNKARVQWRCVCDCGVEKDVQACNLVNGTSISCGCYRDSLPHDAWLASVTTHGMTKTPTWSSWRSMIKRCYGAYSINFDKYGGRGISVCEAWRVSFEAFYADMGERPEGMSLDRINVNGNYEPENCRWATRTQQARNTTANRIINFKGVDYCLEELAEKLSLSTQTVSRRIELGIPLSMVRWNGYRTPRP